jgi:hypothetical protein
MAQNKAYSSLAHGVKGSSRVDIKHMGRTVDSVKGKISSAIASNERLSRLTRSHSKTAQTLLSSPGVYALNINTLNVDYIHSHVHRASCINGDPNDNH